MEELDYIALDKEDVLNSNLDDPNRHNVGGSMNRPVRNADPLSPRNIVKDPMEYKHSEDDKFALDVDQVLHEIAQLLVTKNKKYGNSALEPSRIFSQAHAVEQIKVRIDDKLSRIRNQNIEDDEDVLKDLIGYLVLLRIAIKGEV